jgi:hypothetical protein
VTEELSAPPSIEALQIFVHTAWLIAVRAALLVVPVRALRAKLVP